MRDLKNIFVSFLLSLTLCAGLSAFHLPELLLLEEAAKQEAEDWDPGDGDFHGTCYSSDDDIISEIVVGAFVALAEPIVKKVHSAKQRKLSKINKYKKFMEVFLERKVPTRICTEDDILNQHLLLAGLSGLILDPKLENVAKFSCEKSLISFDKYIEELKKTIDNLKKDEQLRQRFYNRVLLHTLKIIMLNPIKILIDNNEHFKHISVSDAEEKLVENLDSVLDTSKAEFFWIPIDQDNSQIIEDFVKLRGEVFYNTDDEGGKIIEKTSSNGETPTTKEDTSDDLIKEFKKKYLNTDSDIQLFGFLGQCQNIPNPLMEHQKSFFDDTFKQFAALIIYRSFPDNFWAYKPIQEPSLMDNIKSMFQKESK